MNFISEETKQLMADIGREYSVPLGKLMALAASAFADGLQYAMSQFPLSLGGVNKDPAPEDT
jgi:hypothetical protein